jgi:uroporphyrinogen-III synthase
VARDVLPAELTQRGARVEVVEAYRTVVPEAAAAWVGKPDCVTFTSSSTVRNFVEMGGAESLAGITVASIGPVTTAAARELGIEVTVQAREFTIDGLVNAVLGIWAE